ncbi:MAG: TolC family protein [Planctomycetaceae bacterium]|nr:TolC family protein [Planctomycetaceae bacterium]
MAFRSPAQNAHRSRRATVVCLVLCLLWSCRHQDERHSYLLEGDRMTECIYESTRIEHPDLDCPAVPNMALANEPRRLGRNEREEIWDLTLGEAIQIALSNSKVIRSAGQFLSPGNPILNNPSFATTTYDPAIQQTGSLFGQRGVEAALSDFDTQFVTQMVWGRSEAIQNNAFTSGGLPPGSTLVNETGSFNSVLQKRLGTGGQVAVSHAWNYTGSNVPAALFPSVYEGNVRAEFRQPLWAGAGAEYTRIAGPISTNIQGVTGVQQGVIIARINEDIALAQFEHAVHQLVHDVESLYWQLHLAYRSFDVQSESHEEVLDMWRLVDALRRAQTGTGGPQEAAIREAEIDLEGRVAQARDNIYSVEAQLRLLLNLPVNDGRIIRPVDDPVSAKLEPSWTACLSDALVRRPEVRRQKWNIKSLEQQLKAAENLTMPRLDFVSAYQVGGFGDDLLGPSADGRSPNNDLGSAYGTLARGNQTGWNLGFEFSTPLGRRFALSQLRAVELQLAKARTLLGAQEIDISHEVAAAFRDLDRNYLASENAMNRMETARERLQLAKAQYQNDSQRYPIDNVLRAQEAVTQAQLAFLSSLVQYNVAINDLNFRSGRSLAENNILLHEGGWCEDAYWHAAQQAYHRLHAWENPHLCQQPEALTGNVMLQPMEPVPYEPPADPPVAPQDDELPSPLELPLPEAPEYLTPPQRPRASLQLLDPVSSERPALSPMTGTATLVPPPVE